MFTKPHLQLNRATDITAELLNKMNITCLILDVDNTLCLKKGKIILDGVMNWLEKMQNDGIKLIILSNAKPKRMEGIAKNFGLPFVGLGGKPLTFGYRRAAKRMGESIKNCAIVGDQLLTDILGGNLAGCKTILVCPVELESSFGFKIKRGIERKLLKKYNLKCDF
ncbi:MAG: YqeG family HAD IIIA-type phosphatase [Clostridia bacterium]|nr:YqeG family HAD IIIA-type phosphatase [Clostridia bacterium]MBQ7108638.1 YqeG family HAD IIIA-type phosphatase [Clostridia bacterium]